MTETLLLTPTEENLALAARALREGQLVGMPTETVYGLGVNALDEEAVRAIFAAKGRPADNPLIVHVPDIASAEPLCHMDERSRRVMAHFCPGPLTVLLPKKPIVPQVVNAGLPSVAIRIPAHPIARRLLELSGVPVAAPSANTSGKPSPTTARHVFDDLAGKLTCIIDGGECQVGLESTVLDLTREVPTVLRPGGITPDMLLEVLDEVAVADSVLRPLQKGEKALSPGMLYKHYAPKGMLSLVSGSPEAVAGRIRKLYSEAEQLGKTVQVLAFQEHLSAYAGLNAKCIGSLAAPETVARSLFATLRQADAEGIDVLYSEVLPAEGVGLAVMNRLSRAAGFRTIEADEEQTP
jgi:L-threonylcarbamoyladenylate synthase